MVSEHARLRMAQRNVHPDDLEYILAHGRRIRNGNGSQCIFLAARDLPGEDRAGRRAKLEGTTVVIVDDNVVTIYRNRRGCRRVRKNRRRAAR
jgi:hypothetical protein